MEQNKNIDVETFVTEQVIKEKCEAIQKMLGWELIFTSYGHEDNPNYGYYDFHRNKDEKKKEYDYDSGGDSWSWNKDDVLPFDTNYKFLYQAIDFIESEGYDFILKPVKNGFSGQIIFNYLTPKSTATVCQHTLFFKENENRDTLRKRVMFEVISTYANIYNRENENNK